MLFFRKFINVRLNSPGAKPWVHRGTYPHVTLPNYVLSFVDSIGIIWGYSALTETTQIFFRIILFETFRLTLLSFQQVQF